ncbi:hypothetical protein BECAL_00609 [Bellilinea caldifistulae]|nr:hypothetical protein BECAL_00609 [Bellilinea caldifistulae]
MAVSGRAVAEAGWETPHSVRGDINVCSAVQVSLTLGVTLIGLRHRETPSGGVAVSGRAVAEAGWETPHSVRGDINVCSAVQESLTLGVTLIGLRHRERAKRAWRSPAKPSRRPAGRPLTPFGVTLMCVVRCKCR